MTADQSPLFPRASTARLRTILAARLPADPKWVAWVDGVVGELAGVDATSPAEPLTEEWFHRPIATPPQTIDRAALDFLLDTMLWQADGTLARVDFEKYLDRILALVRPVEGVWPEHPDQTVAVVDRLTGRELGGVVISRQDAADLAFVARVGEPHVLDTERAERVLALAARLEALS